MAGLDDDEDLIFWILLAGGIFVLWNAFRDAAATESTGELMPATPGTGRSAPPARGSPAPLPLPPNAPDDTVGGAILDAVIPQTLSPQGEAFLKQNEGLVLTPKPDASGREIGYGHFIKPGDTWQGSITQTQADELFDYDVGQAEALVRNNVTAQLSQNQFDALVDLAYNIPAALGPRSNVVLALNAGDYTKAAANMLIWNKVQGNASLSLSKRRKAEQKLFNQ